VSPLLVSIAVCLKVKSVVSILVAPDFWLDVCADDSHEVLAVVDCTVLLMRSFGHVRNVCTKCWPVQISRDACAPQK
jgi:hypothetical protein